MAVCVSEQDEKGISQREENNTLLRSMVGLTRILGGAIVVLLLSGGVAAWSDHFKLAEVSAKVDALVATIGNTGAAERERSEKNFQEIAQIHADLVIQKAVVLAQDGRIRDLENAKSRSK
jgi:hypothetical protein